ncbi:MAG: RNA polymerase sigma factor [Actinomycetota bacterium]|nr:RNA polymerase sigma factor [Actinomycetota bacterium]
MQFGTFVHDHGERIRRALVAYYGVEVGGEAADEALAVAWERWASLAGMDNPAGYVYRIGQSKARPHVRWFARRRLFPDSEPVMSVADPAALLDLVRALERLSADQRSAVMLVKSYGYSHREVAALLDVSESVVNNLVHRGVTRLRTLLEVHS